MSLSPPQIYTKWVSLCFILFTITNVVSSVCVSLSTKEVGISTVQDKYFTNNNTLLLHTRTKIKTRTNEEGKDGTAGRGFAYIKLSLMEWSNSFRITTGLESSTLMFGIMAKSELFDKVLKNHTHNGYNAKWEVAVNMNMISNKSVWSHNGMVQDNLNRIWKDMSDTTALHTTCTNDLTAGCDLHITAQLSLDGRPELVLRRSRTGTFIQRIKAPYEINEDVYLVLSNLWSGTEQTSSSLTLPTPPIRLHDFCTTFYGCAPAKILKEEHLVYKTFEQQKGAKWTLSHLEKEYTLSVTSRHSITEDRNGRGALRMIGYPFPNDPPLVSNDFWKTANTIESNDQIVTVVLPVAKQFRTMTLYQDQNLDGDEVEPKQNVLNVVEIWVKKDAGSSYTMPIQTMKIEQDTIVISFGELGTAAYTHWQARFTDVSNISESERYFSIRRWDVLDISTFWCRARESDTQDATIMSTNRFSCRYAKVLFNNQRQTDEINFDQTKVKDSGGVANLEIYGKKEGESKEYLITNVRQKMCASDPCQNGGVCTDGILSQYTCECVGGFFGANCVGGFFTFGVEESTTLTSYQVFTAQEDGEINIEAYGAGGKRGFPAGVRGGWPAGGSGGFAKGLLLVKKGESFAIFVGGAGKGYGTTNNARAGGGLVGVFGPFSTETPGIEQIVSGGGNSNGLNAVLIAGSGGGGGNCGGTFENRNGGYGGGEKAGNGRNSGPGGSNPCGTSCNARTPAEGHSGFKGDAAGGNGGGGGAGWWPGKAGGGTYGAGGGSGYARSDVMNPLIYASKGSNENEDGKVVIKFSAKQKSSCKATFRKTAGKPNAKSCDIEHLEPLKFNGLYETYGGDCAKQCESFGSDCDAYAEKSSGSECQLYKKKDEWSSDKSLCAEEASQQWNGFYQRQCPIFEHRYESQTNANEPHTFTATVNGDIKFKLWGAGGMPGAKCKGCADCPDRCSDRGVEADRWAGGRGGYTQGVVKDVKVGDTFTIFVGGPGQGYGTTTSFGSGGGLVAVFRNNDHLTVDELIAQPERALLVAGSGGGSVNGHYGEGHSGGGGKRGGGLRGEDAAGCGSWGGCSSWNGGTSATQTTGHKQFQGRPAGTNGCQAGGGAGWWGGTGTNGNGFNSCNAGSGGSGYIDSDVVDAFMFGAMDSTTEDIDWNEAGHGASKYTTAKKSEGLVLAVGI